MYTLGGVDNHCRIDIISKICGLISRYMCMDWQKLLFIQCLSWSTIGYAFLLILCFS